MRAAAYRGRNAAFVCFPRGIISHWQLLNAPLNLWRLSFQIGIWWAVQRLESCTETYLTLQYLSHIWWKVKRPQPWSWGWLHLDWLSGLFLLCWIYSRHWKLNEIVLKLIGCLSAIFIYLCFSTYLPKWTLKVMSIIFFNRKQTHTHTWSNLESPIAFPCLEHLLGTRFKDCQSTSILFLK